MIGVEILRVVISGGWLTGETNDYERGKDTFGRPGQNKTAVDRGIQSITAENFPAQMTPGPTKLVRHGDFTVVSKLPSDKSAQFCPSKQRP